MTRIKECKICGKEKTMWVPTPSAKQGGYMKCRPCSVKGSRKYRQDNPANRLWSSCKNRANRLGLEFTLTQEDVSIPEYCPILGIPIVTAYTKRCEGTPSIDRVDNTKGYTKDNIVVCSWRANRLKNNGTITELSAIVSYYTPPYHRVI